MLDMSPEEIINLCTNKSTSYLVEDVLHFPYLSQPFKKQLIHVISTRIDTLATHPAGSHVVEACYGATANIPHVRQQIAQALAYNRNLWRDRYGKRVWSTWQMKTYTEDYSAWRYQSTADREGMKKFARENRHPLDDRVSLEIEPVPHSDAHKDEERTAHQELDRKKHHLREIESKERLEKWKASKKRKTGGVRPDTLESITRKVEEAMS